MSSVIILPLLKCQVCNKKYYRESAYNKHKLLCIEVVNNETPLLNDLNDLNDLNELNELNELKLENKLEKRCSKNLEKIIIELIKSNNQLKKDVNELKKWAQVKKRKINILDWLNDSLSKTEEYLPIENYTEYISNIVITRKDLEYVFNSDLISGIQEIIENYMNAKSSKSCVPFQSFDQKDNIIYVYTDNLKWEFLSQQMFNKIIFPISKLILIEFGNWKEENKDKLYADDFSTIVIQNTKKVIGGDIPLEKQQNKIYRNMYKYLKKNLQNTIEYEFI